MFLNKIGFDHIEYNKNNQDYGFENDFDKVKCVVDGCSEGEHSEVGVKLFCELMQRNGYIVEYAFEELTNLLGTSSNTVRDYLCFTILSAYETDTQFYVTYCGDGYIIKQKWDDSIEFEKIDDGEFPKYFIYNYMPSDKLAHYKDGVTYTDRTFPKSEYKSIGLASDGLRYIFGKDYEEEFIELLKQRKLGALKRLINREHKHFKDDITIVF